jgi:hypothetical protein
MSLDQILRGMAAGSIRTIDPISTSIHWFDRWTSGAGLSDKDRAIPTAVSAVYQAVYPNPNRSLSASDYTSRAIGHGIGVVGTAAALAATYCFVSPIVAVAAPVALGIYGIARTVGRYIHNSIYGEKIGRTYQKSSFMDGYRWGYHQGTTYNFWGSLFGKVGNAILNPIITGHNMEAVLTGRNVDQSRINSRLTSTAGGMRRNFRAILGSTIGSIVGGLANVFTLGTYAIGKNAYHLGRTLYGRPFPQRQPTYVTAF